MSPVDSAIGSGVTSGVTTNAPSAVAEGDLEDFKDEEPGSAGFPPYNQPPPFPEQARGMLIRINYLSVWKLTLLGILTVVGASLNMNYK